MPSVFSLIIAGQLPGRFVWRDEVCVAFLSINPLNDGHVLVVPREEIDDWLDLSDGLRDHLFGVAQQLGRAIKTAYHAPKVGAVLAGLEVPHAHIHLVPIYAMDDLDSTNPDPSPDPAKLDTIADTIRKAMTELGISSPLG